MTLRTTVAIVGAGPAGLLLGHLLRSRGIDSMIVENHSREQVLARVRAGVLEESSVEVLAALGLDGRLRRDGLVHRGIHLQFEGSRHRIDFDALIGRTVTVYGQQQVVADLVAAHDENGSAIFFDASSVRPDGIETDQPTLRFDHGGVEHLIEADYVVGADGFHGVCRTLIPDDRLTVYQHDYPFAWLGILADVAPSTDELIYALHGDGFAMHSMRSPSVSRLYLQVDPADDIAEWSDQRIWASLQTRLGIPGWTLHEGPIREKSILPMRSFVTSTLHHGSLTLVGDAGHIVPPTGAKGLNSAIADVALLGRALAAAVAGDRQALASYSERALRRQWKTQYFSQWMTDMLHVSTSGDPDERAHAYRTQVGQLDFVTGSVHAQRTLAEQYTGLSLDEVNA